MSASGLTGGGQDRGAGRSGCRGTRGLRQLRSRRRRVACRGSAERPASGRRAGHVRGGRCGPSLCSCAGKNKAAADHQRVLRIAVRCSVRRSVLAPLKQSGRRQARLLWLARLRQLAPALLWARGTSPPVRPTRHSAGVAARTILRRGLVWHATQSVFDATAAVCPASAFRHTPRGPT